jgi:hypothetical protein
MIRRLPLIPCYLLGFGLGLVIGLLDDFAGHYVRRRVARD